MIEQIKTIVIAVLVSAIVSFLAGTHYGQAQAKQLIQAAHTAVQTSK